MRKPHPGKAPGSTSTPGHSAICSQRVMPDWGSVVQLVPLVAPPLLEPELPDEEPLLELEAAPASVPAPVESARQPVRGSANAKRYQRMEPR